MSMPAALASPPAVAPGLDRRILVGLCGVLLAVLVSGFNENVTKVALADIRGAMGFSVDDGSWKTRADAVCAAKKQTLGTITEPYEKFQGLLTLADTSVEVEQQRR